MGVLFLQFRQNFELRLYLLYARSGTANLLVSANLLVLIVSVYNEIVFNTGGQWQSL